MKILEFVNYINKCPICKNDMPFFVNGWAHDIPSSYEEVHNIFAGTSKNDVELLKKCCNFEYYCFIKSADEEIKSIYEKALFSEATIYQTKFEAVISFPQNPLVYINRIDFSSPDFNFDNLKSRVEKLKMLL